MAKKGTAPHRPKNQSASFDGLKENFKSRLLRLIQASEGRIWLVSGYRSVERQTQLWNAAVKKYGSAAAARKWVAPPGKSNHNHGVAADLAGDLALAKRLAPQFGLHFPMDWEPWHIEPLSHDHEDAEAWTVGPNGETAQQDRHDLKYQMTAFMDILERGPDAPVAPSAPAAPAGPASTINPDDLIPQEGL
jgi:hypothetical protein